MLRNIKGIVLLGLLLCLSVSVIAAEGKAVSYADYVNPLVGTDSTHDFSTGNTYPAIAVPWGMNFWTPQTNKMGNGWGYQYDAHKIRGFKQTHQPSPWINDYAAFYRTFLFPRMFHEIDKDNKVMYYSPYNGKVLPGYMYTDNGFWIRFGRHFRLML